MFLRQNDIGFTHDMVNIMNITSEGLHILKKLRVDDQVTLHDGSTKAPAYSFESQQNTGMYLNNGNNIGFSLTDTEEMSLSTSGLKVNRAIYSSNNIESDGQFKGPNQRSSSPTYSFNSAGNTGMYLNGYDLAFSVGNNRKGYFNNSGLIVNGSFNASGDTKTDRQFKGPDRNRHSPTYSFDTSTNSGMYFKNNNDLAFSVSSSEIVSLSTNSMRVEGGITSRNDIVSQANVIAQSDRRSKHDIHDINNALEKILALQGVKFKRNKDNSDSLGFIAQDVRPILPEVVNINPDTGLLGVNYGVITAVLSQGMKEMHQKWEASLAQIQKRLDSIEHYIMRL